MRVLIVDDNAAIQEILSEILSVDGYETVSASTLEDALEQVETFKPDAVLLDISVGESNGLDLISMAAENDVQLSKVIVLTTGMEQVPKDDTSIVGVIQKPFKSTEVLDMLRSIFDISKEKPKRSLFRSIFGKKDDAKETDMDLKFGTSYLFVEDDQEYSYKAASFFLEEDTDVLMITSGKIKAAIERVDNEYVNVIGISSKEGPDYIEPEKIGTLMGTITEYVNTHEMPVVMIDDLDVLIEKNDLNSVITMVHQIINNSSKKMSLIASVRSDDMTEKDKELLAGSMEIYTEGKK